MREDAGSGSEPEIASRDLRPAESGLHGTVFQPAGSPRPLGVVLIGGSDGGEPQLIAKGLARAGFVALSLAYFARPGLPERLQQIPIEYFARAVEEAGRSTEPVGGPSVVLGISRGSEAAMLTAIHRPGRVAGVVAVVPGNVVLCGWPPGPPAWLLDGHPLPFVYRFGPQSAVPEAEIPAERIAGPLLLVSAGADQVWPSAAMARALAERRRRTGDHDADRLLEYPRASHALGFLYPGSLRAPFLRIRSPRPEDEEAQADVWPKLIDFLQNVRLRTERPSAASRP